MLDVDAPLSNAPSLSGFTCSLIEDTSIEVEVSKGASINQLFSELSNQGIAVTSMRNKANRLEELFVNLVSKGDS